MFGEITPDANDNWNYGAIESAMSSFDPSMPIVLDQDGMILDGNHRTAAFMAEGKENRLLFCICDYAEFCSNNTDEMFVKNDEYFYNVVAQIAK